MKQLFNKIKQYSISILSIIFIIAVVGLVIFFVIYLKGMNKKIQIVPEFKIIDSRDESVDTLNESINIAKDILKKVKREKI